MSDIDTDKLTTAELLDAALGEARADPTTQSEPRWALVRALHRRTDREIFDRAALWCRSGAPLERSLGADVLGQLGAGSPEAERVFASESAPHLTGLLQDSEEHVLRSAICALGHLDAGNPDEIAPLSAHPSSEVRQAVAFALAVRGDERSVDTLITLSRDVNGDVRDWATFGLGSLTSLDTPAIRAALWDRVEDKDEDARGEALVGLATRGDRRVAAIIIAEFKAGSTHYLVADAAGALLEKFPEAVEVREALASRPLDDDQQKDGEN